MPRGGWYAAPLEGLCAALAWLGLARLAKHALDWLACTPHTVWRLWLGLWTGAPSQAHSQAPGPLPEPWEGRPDLRVYRRGGGDPELLTVHTAPHSFQVDLAALATESGYFEALARSCMQETSERRLDLDHVPSATFRAILEWVFFGHFALAEEELLPAIQAASYLLLPGFLSRCLLALRPLLGPRNCLAYLHSAEAMGCPELRAEVCGYLSAHLLELAEPVTARLALPLQEELARLRLGSPPHLCVLRAENVSKPQPGATPGPLQGLHCRPLPPAEGDWRCATRLPFRADKWSFSAAQLFNYLFLVGGYRERHGARGSAFRMAAFRYNPLTDAWQATAAPNKRRRHFSTVVSGQFIFAIGGWYLDSLLAPDSSTCLYRAVERYDPWTDRWTFVSPLPLGGTAFTLSLAHSLPLCTAHAGSIYALGSLRHSGETLLLHYCVATDTWQELRPSLARADADLPALCFLGGAEPLYVVGSGARGTVVAAFSPGARRWGAARELPGGGAAGQGVARDGLLYVASPERGAVLQLELGGPRCRELPPPPFPLSYEALCILHFPGAPEGRGPGRAGALQSDAG